VMNDGVADKLCGFLVDVTDRRCAEQKANDYLRQLARLNRAAGLGEMATSIAHEVKQPLFAIVGNAQIVQRMLKQDQPDMEEVRAALGEIVGDGNRAASIIDNVRSLVRKEQQSAEPLDLNQVALDAIEFITPELRKRSLVLKTELADTLPAITGNSIELQQVILNLVINGAQAIRQTENGSNELLLRTTAQDGFVELAVKDRGVGIEPDQADRLFEPFYTTKAQGTGMGLAINRSIIESHQGRIWATANNSCGATFRFQLPAAGEIKS
jgi:signal transduction histidine kinase